MRKCSTMMHRKFLALLGRIAEDLSEERIIKNVICKGGFIMWFWWFIFFCDLLIPVAMIVCGRMMWKHPPKKINGLIGYRTALSMKNMDTWNFAHNYCGKLWWKWGWIILLPSIIVHIPFYRQIDDEISIISLIVVSVQIVILIASIFPTQCALKKIFTEDGIRR